MKHFGQTKKKKISKFLNSIQKKENHLNRNKSNRKIDFFICQKKKILVTDLYVVHIDSIFENCIFKDRIPSATKNVQIKAGVR